MKKFTLLVFALMVGIISFAQTSVYWRTDGPSDGKWLWGSTCDASGDGQWYYSSWGGFRKSPNCYGNHDVYFDGNGINNMDLNGANDFGVRSIIFTSNATENRTLNANTTDKRTLWLNANNGNPKIENNSTATHTFNVPIFYNAPAQLNPISGNLIFTGAIDNRGNWTDVWGGNNKTLSIASLLGSGGLTIKSTSTIVKITGNCSYTGDTYVDNGTLELQGNIASSTIIVKNGAKLTINGTAITINNLTVETGGIVEVLPGKSLTINGTSNTNSGTIKLLSDASGTATLIGNIEGNAEVQQYLTGNGRNWWYLASPLSVASSSVFSGDQIGKYVEDYLNDNDGNTNAPYYTSPFSTPETLVPGRGYIIKRASTDAATYTFTGGTLNNGDVTITPTRTGNEAAKRGFNLVGNPYPSYIDWNAVYASLPLNHNMRNAIWFRTYDIEKSAMVFHTYGDGDAVPEITSPLIAPMQAFWVKVAADGSNGALTFKNAHRSHYATSANPLKVKAAENRPRLRMVISNGTNTDETLIVGKSYASNTLDSYDIEKMSADNIAIPEIYSVVGSEELVINSLNTLTGGISISLGFRTGQSGTFNLQATQLENIDAKVILVDKLTSTETELKAGTAYTFTSDATTTTDRFSLVLRTPGVVTGVDNAASNLKVSATQGSIVICGTTPGSTVRVFNTVGQQLTSATATGSRTELHRDFTPGIYLVKVNNRTMKISVK